MLEDSEGDGVDAGEISGSYDQGFHHCASQTAPTQRGIDEQPPDPGSALPMGSSEPVATIVPFSSHGPRTCQLGVFVASSVVTE